MALQFSWAQNERSETALRLVITYPEHISRIPKHSMGLAYVPIG